MDHTPWMQRCLQLARNGADAVAPNPMVGAVLVQGERILAEGWHRAYGGPHAEVECLNAFGEGPVPKDAVMYVSLEPCTHHGRTPPCADLLIERGVEHVVVAHMDPFPEVCGRGIARLREAGIRVDIGLCEAEARWTNRRFLTSVEHQRPYIILKWARSADGLLDRHPRDERDVQRISSPITDVLVHRWRSEEQAILVGSRTIVNDDPQLTTRLVEGRSPLRVVIDRNNTAPAGSKVFNASARTLLFTSSHRTDIEAEQVLLAFSENVLDRLMYELNARKIRSLFVEGGAELLGHFLERGLWDEARVITGVAVFGAGTKAPSLRHIAVRTERSDTDTVQCFTNTENPERSWYW